VITGTLTYNSGNIPNQFGNGMDGNTVANYATFPSSFISLSGAIEFQWQPHYNSGSGVLDYMMIARDAATGLKQFEMFWNGPTTEFRVWVFDTAAFRSWYDWTPTFSANDVMHILLVYDGSAGVGLKFRLYINGVLENISSITNDNTWNLGTIDLNVAKIGPANSIIDQIKSYTDSNFSTEIINSRYIEFFSKPKMR
jgi:hypothetical protein